MVVHATAIQLAVCTSKMGPDAPSTAISAPASVLIRRQQARPTLLRTITVIEQDNVKPGS
jgi:hypothetical protein